MLSVSGLAWTLWAFAAAYLLLLALLAIVPARRAKQANGATRFCILIPAHNEELNLGQVLQKLGGLDYPRERCTIAVIADNCTDGTADVARATGVRVMERQNADLRGKGYALEWAMQILLKESGVDGKPAFDAFVVMDADSVLSPSFLNEMSARLAGGEHVLQARYDVLNPGDTWRTKLMTCALALVHVAKPGGREKLGLSVGLKGNGMCFSREVLERVPWSGASVTEDIEYALRIVEAGYRVAFVSQATVWAQMPVDAKQSQSQRERWEGGKHALLKAGAKHLLAGLSRGNLKRADAGLDLLIPPLVEFVFVAGLFTAGSGMWFVLTGSQAAKWSLLAWASVLVAQVSYVVIGLAVARVPFNIACSLIAAPLYALWKIVLVARLALKGGPDGWRRTERHEI